MPERGDEGYTLIETLVAMVVLGVVVAIAVQATVGLLDSMRATQEATAAGAQVRMALNSLEHQVRSGNVLFTPVAEATSDPGCQAFGAAAGTCMRVYTQAGGVPRCAQWQVVPDTAAPGSSLLRTRSFSPAWQTDRDVDEWRVAARGLVPPTAAAPPFQLQGASTAYSSRLLDVTVLAWGQDRRGTVRLTSSLSGRNTTYGTTTSMCDPGPA